MCRGQLPPIFGITWVNRPKLLQQDDGFLQGVECFVASSEGELRELAQRAIGLRQRPSIDGHSGVTRGKFPLDRERFAETAGGIVRSPYPIVRKPQPPVGLARLDQDFRVATGLAGEAPVEVPRVLQ